MSTLVHIKTLFLTISVITLLILMTSLLYHATTRRGITSYTAKDVRLRPPSDNPNVGISKHKPKQQDTSVARNNTKRSRNQGDPDARERREAPRNRSIQEIHQERVQDARRVCFDDFHIEPLSLEGNSSDILLRTHLGKRLDSTLVNDDYNWLFTYIYKVGSSSWSILFKELYQKGHTKLQKKLGCMETRSQCRLTQVRKKLGEKAVVNRFRDYFAVIFVRHPYERLLSAYTSKLVNMPTAWYAKVARDIIKKVRKSPLRTGQKPNLTFEEFIEFVVNGGSDLHWNPMSKLTEFCQLPFDFIGHMETLEDDVDYLFELLGVGNIVQYPQAKHPTGSSNSALLKKQFSKMSQQQLTKLNAMYEQDFRLFGYHLPQNISDFK